jgi:hypothetical protein
METTSNKTKNRLSSLLTALMLVTALAATAISASAGDAKPAITIANLAGSWTVSYFSNASCGNGTHIQEFTLASDGVSSSFADTYNTSGCGQGQNHDETFTIDTLDADGTGTATFSNGDNPLTFQIQVNLSKNVFSLVDVTDVGQYWMGTAVKQ